MTLAQAAKVWNTAALDKYRMATLKEKARIYALDALDQILNAVINNALHEVAQQEMARVAYLDAYRKTKEKKPSRRTYYCVPNKIVDGKLTCKIYCKKPLDDNYLKVCAAKRSEARVRCDQVWNRQQEAA